MTVKKIVAMFALTARAQDAAASAAAAPGDGGRIFADSLDGVSVENFLDGLTSSDYDQTYLYEEVGPVNGDYNDLFSYDGTDVNNSAGRPVNEDSSAGKELDASQLAGEITGNLHNGKGSGFNTCRTCVGQTAAECFAGAATETCNDAQDACRVEMRSRVIGGAVVTKFWSGCSSRIACQAEQSRNFHFGTASTKNLIRNQCKSSSFNNARNYSPSLCTMCAKLGDAGTPNSLLFGANANTLHVSTSPAVSFTFAALETDPTQITDFFTANDWY